MFFFLMNSSCELLSSTMWEAVDLHGEACVRLDDRHHQSEPARYDGVVQNSQHGHVVVSVQIKRLTTKQKVDTFLLILHIQ